MIKRILLNVAVVVPLLVATFLFGVRYNANAVTPRTPSCSTSEAFSAGKLVGPRKSQSLFGEVSDLSCVTTLTDRTFAAPGRLRGSDEQARRISYPIQWDDIKNCFLFYGEPVRHAEPSDLGNVGYFIAAYGKNIKPQTFAIPRSGSPYNCKRAASLNITRLANAGGNHDFSIPP